MPEARFPELLTDADTWPAHEGETGDQGRLPDDATPEERGVAQEADVAAELETLHYLDVVEDPPLAVVGIELDRVSCVAHAFEDQVGVQPCRQHGLAVRCGERTHLPLTLG